MIITATEGPFSLTDGFIGVTARIQAHKETSNVLHSSVKLNMAITKFVFIDYYNLKIYYSI